jgi:hypothetical protein
MTRPQIQSFIPGTEPPPDPVKNDEVETLMWSWLDQRDENKRGAATVKMRHATLLEKLKELGIDRYPYVDAFTGKKRYVVVNREPKLKTTNVPKPPREKKPKKSREKPNPDEQVEVRTIPRSSIEHELDPFAATRAAMEADA